MCEVQEEWFALVTHIQESLSFSHVNVHGVLTALHIVPIARLVSPEINTNTTTYNGWYSLVVVVCLAIEVSQERIKATTSRSSIPRIHSQVPFANCRSAVPSKLKCLCDGGNVVWQLCSG